MQSRRSRRRKYEQIVSAQAADTARMAEIEADEAHRQERLPEFHDILAALQSGGSAADFRAAIDKWSRKPGYSSFNSPNGQMFVNQIVGAAEDEVAADVLRRALTLPASEAEAAAKITEAAAFVTSVPKGGYPTPVRVPFLCSFFWGLQDPQSWPSAWTSAVRSVEELSWHEPVGDLSADYLGYRKIVHELGAPPPEVAHAFYWFADHRFVGLDPTLVDRCTEAARIAEARVDGSYRSNADRKEARLQARAALADLRLLGRALEDRVATAVGRSVKSVVPEVWRDDDVYRADGWMYWRVGPANAAGVRVWVTMQGVALGVYCGH